MSTTLFGKSITILLWLIRRREMIVGIASASNLMCVWTLFTLIASVIYKPRRPPRRPPPWQWSGQGSWQGSWQITWPSPGVPRIPPMIPVTLPSTFWIIPWQCSGSCGMHCWYCSGAMPIPNGRIRHVKLHSVQMWNKNQLDSVQYEPNCW